MDENLEEFRDTFSLFDKKGDNKIERGQVGEVIRALGLNPTQSEIKKSIQEIQTERVSFEELMPIYHSMRKKIDTGSHEEFSEGLRVFDRDGNGFISAAELRHVLTSLGEKLSDDEVNDLLVSVEDSQGQVNYEEFVKMVMAS
ncbi:myosin-2 essential light chain-like isoform X2 [Antedon mediterranea]|uniref:myosin-2 essential light chain-like isoform X2 n=1 Tax=Antedon mediterranea TaxID=105859 RepID=UPI003AF873C8